MFTRKPSIFYGDFTDIIHHHFTHWEVVQRTFTKVDQRPVASTRRRSYECLTTETAFHRVEVSYSSR